MKYIENTVGVQMMIWETNPRKRNINNEIQFLAHNEVEINVGDVIFPTPLNDSASSYVIQEILSKRSASLSNHTNYKAVSTWRVIPTLEIIKSINKISSLKTNKLGERLVAFEWFNSLSKDEQSRVKIKYGVTIEIDNNPTCGSDLIEMYEKENI